MESLMLLLVALGCVYYEYRSARSRRLMTEWNKIYELNQIELGLISNVDRI